MSKVVNIFSNKPRSNDFETQGMQTPIFELPIIEIIDLIQAARETVAATGITTYYRFENLADIQQISKLAVALDHFFPSHHDKIRSFIGGLQWSIYQSNVASTALGEDLRFFAFVLNNNPFGISVAVSRMRNGWSIDSDDVGTTGEDDFEQFLSECFTVDPC